MKTSTRHKRIANANYGTFKIEVPSKVSKKQNFDRVGTTKCMALKIIQQNLEPHASLFQVDVWSFDDGDRDNLVLKVMDRT